MRQGAEGTEHANLIGRGRGGVGSRIHAGAAGGQGGATMGEAIGQGEGSVQGMNSARVGPRGGKEKAGIGTLWQVKGVGRWSVVFQKKRQCKNQFLSTAWEGLPNPTKSIMGGVVVTPPTG